MKIKIPKFLTVKQKRLRATTARKPLRIAATADYEEMAEPNMKLSRALLIVLILHVVAVSGIVAFNAIKTRQASPFSALRSTSVTAKADPIGHAVVSPKENGRFEETKSPRPNSKPAKEERKAEHAKAVAPADSGKTYVVAKGDTPVSIAKKLKVPYDDLLAVNHIEDPHKLQIGQKLLIPAKAPKAKKASE
jgi:LysM repeat protein